MLRSMARTTQDPGHPLLSLLARLDRGEAVVAGVLSGTSADGIDVALTRCGRSGAPELLAFETLPFPADLAGRVRRVLDGEEPGLCELAFLSRDLGLAFGERARSLARARDLGLDLVGSHGQTVFHHDGTDARGAATLQLGDGDFVAGAAGSPTVSDFRQADIAAGGEGAPLSALVDPELFAAAPRPALVLNLGGMANLTLLRAGGRTSAFDVGPANALLDGLARVLLDAPLDRDGASAARGRPDARLLAELLEHPFLDRCPPKSTGRDTFGRPWVERIAGRGRALGIRAEDLLATGVALVAESVRMAIERFLPERPELLILCGGGARNLFLCRELGRRTGLATCSSSLHGVDPDAREALVFAALAARFVLARPSGEPGVTGARPGVVLGKLSLPGALASLP